MDVAFDRGYIGGGGLVHSQLGELMIRDLCRYSTEMLLLQGVRPIQLLLGH